MDSNLKNICDLAAIKANSDGIDPGNEQELVEWIENNCCYSPDQLFFLVLIIGSELADIQARGLGFRSEVDRAYQAAIESQDRNSRNRVTESNLGPD